MSAQRIITQLIEDHGYSESRIAQASKGLGVSVSQPTIHRIKKGQPTVRHEVFVALQRLLEREKFESGCCSLDNHTVSGSQTTPTDPERKSEISSDPKSGAAA